MKLNNYFKELQRRHVVKAGIAYLVISWLLTQVLSILIPVFEMPTSILKSAIIVMAIGFPLWLIFAWIYDFTPDGLQKTDDVEYDSKIHAKKNVKLNRFIIGSLSMAIILLVVNQVRMKNQMTEIKSIKVSGEFDSSIAVMAFADRSPKKDHEYFSDGISEEILNILVGIPDLKVISRTSSFSYKGKDLTATEIGEELKVSHILEGSIRKAGNMVRITAQLINTSDGSQEWSQTFDRNLDSIFKIQDEIAQKVSDQFRVSVKGDSEELSPPDTEAYNLYLEARHLKRQNTKEGLISAEEKVKQSIAIDSTYSNSWDLLASIHVTGTHNFSIGDSNQKFSDGLKAAKKAIEFDPNSADAYATLASLQNYTWNFEASARNMEKAVELGPNKALILGTAALYSYGNLDKGVDLIKSAIKFDPLVYINYYNLGFHYYRMNRLEEAQEYFDKFSLYYPNSQIVHYMKGMVHLAKGEKEEALKEIEQETHEFFSLYGKNFVLFALGRTEECDVALSDFLKKYSESDPANTADLYAFRGDYDTSFMYLNKALEIKDPVLLEALSYPSFKPMRNDPRWDMLIAKIKLPEDHGYSSR